MNYSLRLLEEKDLKLVLDWRNSERIRASMFNDKIITFQEHEKWYQKIRNNKNHCYLMFSINETSTGLVNFKIDTDNNHCFWGFYIGDLNAPKGSGTLMGYLGIDYAYNQLKMKEINGEVLAYNTSSINFHEKLGFCREDVFQKHILKQGRYVDVIRFSLFQEKWLQSKEKIKQDLKNKGINVD